MLGIPVKQVRWTIKRPRARPACVDGETSTYISYGGLTKDGQAEEGTTMTLPEASIHPASVIAEMKKNNVTHVVWLPDSETNFMYEMLINESSLDLVPVCREGETMAIAAGLWVGGKNPWS